MQKRGSNRTEEDDMVQKEEAEVTQKNIPEEVEVDKVDDTSDKEQLR